MDTQIDTHFNPHNQDFTLIYPDGSNITYPLSFLDELHHSDIRLCVVFASQIGACAILLAILSVLTKPEKRRAPIFLINMLSLVLVIIRSILQIVYFFGSWSTTFTYVAEYFKDVSQSAKYTSNATPIIQLLLHICIEMSLILQVRVVYATEAAVNLVMTIISTFIALISVGFFFTVVVQNIQSNNGSSAYYGEWVYPTSRAIFAVSICFFSLMFVIKLAIAIRQRRILGLPGFGPLQVIFIMGCQTMIVPAVFSILENIPSITWDGLSSLTAAMVVVCLPLSSMWASASLNSPVKLSGSGSRQPFFTQSSTTHSAVSSTPSPTKSKYLNYSSVGVQVEKSFDVSVRDKHIDDKEPLGA